MSEPPKDPLDYPRLMEQAVRGVVRQALEVAAGEGLPGDHHFYVTFRTDHPGVALSGPLRAQHPDEMTVVLQHQFWGLKVEPEAFTVTLRFSGRPETITVPLEAVTSFVDPASSFGLRFEPPAPPAEAAEGPPSAPARAG